MLFNNRIELFNLMDKNELSPKEYKLISKTKSLTAKLRSKTSSLKPQIENRSRNKGGVVLAKTTSSVYKIMEVLYWCYISEIFHPSKYPRPLLEEFVMRMSHREEVVGCLTYRMSQEERAISALLPLSLRWCARHQHLGRLNTTHVTTLFSAAFIFGSAFYHGNTLTCNWILCRLPTSITDCYTTRCSLCSCTHQSD